MLTAGSTPCYCGLVAAGHAASEHDDDEEPKGFYFGTGSTCMMCPRGAVHSEVHVHPYALDVSDRRKLEKQEEDEEWQ